MSNIKFVTVSPTKCKAKFKKNQSKKIYESHGTVAFKQTNKLKREIQIWI